MSVPVIDISGFDDGGPGRRAAIAQAWDQAFRTMGFATIAGHGLPEGLLEEVYLAGLAFFRQPMAAKLRLGMGEGGGYGYEAAGVATVGATHGLAAPPDLVEALGFRSLRWEGRFGLDDPDVVSHVWPDHPPGFREVVERYVDAGYDLGQRLMRIAAVALGLPQDWFAPFFGRMTHNLRLAYYPDQTEPPREGQLRNGPHTDFTGFTILRQDDAPGGLQVQGPDGAWSDVRPIPGTLVINSGDLLQRWTNDRWRSNVHRVVNPDRAITGSTVRLSVVLFTGPDLDAVIETVPTCVDAAHPRRYAPIRARDHFAEKMRQTYG